MALHDSPLQQLDLFFRMVEQAPIGMYVVDGDFLLRQVNALAAPVFGTIHPLVGRDFAEVITELRRQDSRVVISVKDTGLGIPPAMLSQVFEMFMQIEMSRDYAHGGLGIGLALSKKLVEMHGGSIVAFSDGHGKGSLFEVSLPALDAHSNVAEVEAVCVLPATIPRRRILVVDDLRVARITLERLLIKMGQEVQSVSSGQLALQAAIADPPDILISDIGMPDMNGYELAKKVRAEPNLRKVVLVALTGFGKSSDQHLAKESGFDWHITKPARYEDLRDLLLR